jgi:hypothetical protein
VQRRTELCEYARQELRQISVPTRSELFSLSGLNSATIPLGISKNVARDRREL